ncbi:expressed unknown protein [Seminavis robusta]|uniref:Uncharacterized protein n=1 Tax=Seminavis robusta TaxID=568900 RepID=A0A9N8HV16_9STRA|nr:expressed unknown protein [Seminavis robusta]|eukprot:Sro2216_g319440.1 n/a (300) ;mRNA; f:6725-7624
MLGVLKRYMFGGSFVDDASKLAVNKSSVSDPPQPMLVIGAGLPRTGTASFQEAMERLGLHCYNMFVMRNSQGHVDIWHEHLVDHTLSFDGLVDHIVASGYSATVDVPMAFKYKDLAKRYPQAKVVLTVRSEEPSVAAEAWSNSVTATIFKEIPILESVPFRWIPVVHKTRLYLEAMYREVQFPLHNSHELAGFYNPWNQQVIDTIPSENLLIFRAADGWRPLCEFLANVSQDVEQNCHGLLSSHEPYPFVNDATKLKALFSSLRAFAIVVQVCLVVLPVALLVALAIRWYKAGAKEKSS